MDWRVGTGVTLVGLSEELPVLCLVKCSKARGRLVLHPMSVSLFAEFPLWTLPDRLPSETEAHALFRIFELFIPEMICK